MNFAGLLGRTNYWKKLLIGTLIFLAILIPAFWLLDIQNAEMAGASDLSQGLALFFGVLNLLNILGYTVYVASLIVRRARDIGSVPIWVVVAWFIPFGILIVGLIPSRK